MDSSIAKVIPMIVEDSQMLIGEVIWMTEVYTSAIDKTATSWRNKKQTCVALSSAEAKSLHGCSNFFADLNMEAKVCGHICDLLSKNLPLTTFHRERN